MGAARTDLIHVVRRARARAQCKVHLSARASNNVYKGAALAMALSARGAVGVTRQAPCGARRTRVRVGARPLGGPARASNSSAAGQQDEQSFGPACDVFTGAKAAECWANAEQLTRGVRDSVTHARCVLTPPNRFPSPTPHSCYAPTLLCNDAAPRRSSRSGVRQRRGVQNLSARRRSARHRRQQTRPRQVAFALVCPTLRLAAALTRTPRVRRCRPPCLGSRSRGWARGATSCIGHSARLASPPRACATRLASAPGAARTSGGMRMAAWTLWTATTSPAPEPHRVHIPNAVPCVTLWRETRLLSHVRCAMACTLALHHARPAPPPDTSSVRARRLFAHPTRGHGCASARPRGGPLQRAHRQAVCRQPGPGRPAGRRCGCPGC